MRMMARAWALGVCVCVALCAGATNAAAQHKMTRLGSPATRVTAPLKDAAALKKAFSVKKNQDAVARVLEIEGLAPLAPKVLEALTSGSVAETSVAPGTTLQWMALRRKGKPDVIMNAVWAGKKPFPGFEFTIDEGPKQHHFLVPKACGNLALVNTTERALPECVHVAVNRSCEQKQATFSASGTAITSKQATKVKVYRDGSKVGELLPESFTLALPIEAGRYTFMATDTYGREYGTCERDLAVEACAAPPPPPPPPAPTSCGALLTAVRGKGGITLHVDATASGQGASPANKAVLTIIGPDGKPVTFGYQGADKAEAEVSAPFTADFFVKKAKPGTYTLKAAATSGVAGAEPRSCESTVLVPETDNVDFFVDGAFGKQRRQYDLAGLSGAAITPGFCDPEIGVKGGPIFWFNGQRASFAPALGVALPFGDLGDYDYGDNKYNKVSPFVEAVINVHFKPRGGYVGTGLGYWDLFDGDHGTATWVVNFGAPLKENAKGDQLFFIGEGRLFFDAPNGIDNNYQVWGGLRYVWK